MVIHNVQEIPDEIKNIVELFYIRDAQIAREEAHHLKKSHPELRSLIDDVLRLFEDAPEGVYMFYDKLIAYHSENEILDNSFADFSLSDIPKDANDSIPKTTSGLIDVSAMLDVDDSPQNKNKSKSTKPSLSTLTTVDNAALSPLDLEGDFPMPDLTKSEEIEVIRLGGDIDLNIDLDLDLDEQVNVEDLIGSIGNDNVLDKKSAANKKLQRANTEPEDATHTCVDVDHTIHRQDTAEQTQTKGVEADLLVMSDPSNEWVKVSSRCPRTQNVKLTSEIQELEPGDAAQESAFSLGDAMDAEHISQDDARALQDELEDNTINALTEEIEFPHWDSPMLSEEDEHKLVEKLKTTEDKAKYASLPGENIEILGMYSTTGLHHSGIRDRLTQVNASQADRRFQFDNVNATDRPRRSTRNTAELTASLRDEILEQSGMGSASSLNKPGGNSSAENPGLSADLKSDRRSGRPRSVWGQQDSNFNALDERYVHPTLLSMTPISPVSKVQCEKATAELPPVPKSPEPKTASVSPNTVSQAPEPKITSVSLNTVPQAPEPKLTSVALNPIPVLDKKHAPEQGAQALQKLKPFSRIPQLQCSMDDLSKHSDINAKAGFLLSMVDGITSIADIFDLSMFSEPETAIELVKLEEEGIITFI